MPDPVTALVVGGSQLIGSSMQASAAGDAAAVQSGAAEAGIAEQRRQFEAMRELLKPYTEAGVPALKGLQPYAEAGAPALEQQQALLGLRGPEAQRAAIAGIEGGAGYQAQVQAGEEALLQRASATGGLRGGNIQAALGQFRPQLLQQEIERQYGRLGGMADIGRVTQQNLAQIGQSSAAGTGSAGLQTGTNVANLLSQQGAALAGGELGEAKAYGQLFNLPAQFLGMQMGGGKAGGFGNLFSDIRLKKNIKKISTRNDGLNVYEFDYIWGGGRQIGLMAQEVQGVYPDAVSESGGYLMVNYSKV
jgi:hypothetical protein